MCGLTGIFDPVERRPVDRRVLTAMNDRIAHRGPDGDGFHFEPGLGLGHRRLSIIDIEGGAQPMYSRDSNLVVVFNGEIYNFRELREDLIAEGWQFQTNSDTEVILGAYAHWGQACVERMNGMFVIALWDRKAETLFLARDRLGKKPLYYSVLPDGQMIFGSELKALLCHPDLRRDLDPQAVEDYFAYGYIQDPKTIYTSVRKLEAGHTMTWARGVSPLTRRYWSPNLEGRAFASEGEAIEELVALLRRVTKSRLISDVPLGAFLSGGLDSSAIVAMMAGLSDEPVKTFSIGFEDREFDESGYAQAIAEQYQTDHHLGWVNPDDFSQVDRLAGIYDEPFGDSSALPTLRVCEAARAGVTVCLSGDGGDEALAGYRRYLFHARQEAFRRKVPEGLRRALFGPLGALYPKLDWAPRVLRAKTTFMEMAMSESEAFFQGMSASDDTVRQALFSSKLKQDLQGYHGREVVAAAFREADATTDDPVRRAQYVDLRTWLPGDILTKVDRASMAVSLEVRAPLLDHESIDWSLALPSDLKIKGMNGKYLLKKAMEPHLPHDLMYRPKQGFSIPLAAWFRGPLSDRVDTLVSGQRMADSGLFEQTTMAKIAREHQHGQRDHSRLLWLLFMFDGFLAESGLV